MKETNYFETYINKIKELQSLVAADAKTIENDPEIVNSTKINVKSFLNILDELMKTAQNNDYIETGRTTPIVHYTHDENGSFNRFTDKA